MVGNNWARQNEKGTQRKLDLIERKGGGYQRCGYNRCLQALQFHHRDPSTKVFTLDQSNLSKFINYLFDFYFSTSYSKW